jgi:hypothetical protein
VGPASEPLLFSSDNLVYQDYSSHPRQRAISWSKFNVVSSKGVNNAISFKFFELHANIFITWNHLHLYNNIKS